MIESRQKRIPSLGERAFEQTGGSMTQKLASLKQGTISISGSISRTTRPTLIAAGGLRRRSPPFLPRTVSISPVTPS